jgi:hypothetical protein
MSEKPGMPRSDLSALAAKWPSAIVAREKVGEFSGGILNSKTMANLDSLGQGPERVRIGRKNAYPVLPLIDWMRQRAK